MRIQVLHRYQGVPSQGQTIWPGVYDLDAPDLYGTAEYLIKNEHAILVDGDAHPVVTEVVDTNIGTVLAPVHNAQLAPEPQPEPVTVVEEGNELATTADRKRGRPAKA